MEFNVEKWILYRKVLSKFCIKLNRKLLIKYGWIETSIEREYKKKLSSFIREIYGLTWKFEMRSKKLKIPHMRKTYENSRMGGYARLRRALVNSNNVFILI